MSRIFGLVREAVIAAYFGAGAQTDSFFVALRIPDLLFNSLIGFLVAISFIPIFSEYLVANYRNRLWEFVSVTLNFMTIILLGFAGITAVLAPILVRIIAPGLTAEGFSLAVMLTRIMIPIIIFGGLTGLAKSILNALNHFTVPAFIPLVYNIVVISTILLLGKKVGVTAIAIGVLFAALFQFLIQLPVLLRKWKRYYFTLNVKHEGLIKMGRLLYPITLALILGQTFTFVEVYLATQICPGAFSYLSYANRIFMIPQQTFAVAISTVLFPALAADVAHNKKNEMVEKLSYAIRITTFIILPTSFLLLGFSSQIIQFLLGRGAFEASAVESTSNALSAYSLGLLPFCVRHLIIYAFFALKDSKTLLKITAIMVPLHISLDLILIRYFSYWGLALGTSVSVIVHMWVLIILLRIRIGEIGGVKIIYSFLKNLACSIIMMLAIFPLKERMFHFQSFSHFIQQSLYLLSVFFVAFVVYLLATRIFKVEEAYQIFDILFEIKKSSQPTS